MGTVVEVIKFAIKASIRIKKLDHTRKINER